MQYSRKPALRGLLSEHPARPVVSQLDQVRSLLRQGGGPISLYKGLGTQLVGVVPTSLVYMPTYELVTQLVRSLEQGGIAERSLPASQLASIATGIVSSCVRVPISVVKVRATAKWTPPAS
eukprot:scaffold68728_cov32-Tisochrysis_lutea.AAC.3